jgi:hypothetical protein
MPPSGPARFDRQSSTSRRVAHAYAERLERRARASADSRLRALADRAHKHIADIPRPLHEASDPTLTVKLEVGDGTTLSMLAAVVRFDHASDITLAELWIELLFPADGPTRRWFETVSPRLPSRLPTAERLSRASGARR